jgi:hypothetical protein
MIASTRHQGFACLPYHTDLSAFHETKYLGTFQLGNYIPHAVRTATENHVVEDMMVVEFLGDFKNISQWWISIHLSPPKPIVLVCYGGAFGALGANIKRVSMDTLTAIELSLTRGNNIIEGHYAERTWAALLSSPVPPHVVQRLLTMASGHSTLDAFVGALTW